MYAFLGHYGAGLPAHRLHAAAARLGTGPSGGIRLIRGEGWALASARVFDRGGVAAALDGAIEGRLALATRLEVRGLPVADRNDAALAHSAFALDGAGFAAHVGGGYAAAVVDARAEPVLVLAAAGAGGTPLYCHWEPDGGGLCFASALPALLALLPDRPGPRVRVLAPGTTAVCSRRSRPLPAPRADAAGLTAPARRRSVPEAGRARAEAAAVRAPG
ncbi:MULTISPECIES: hypothetical protein [Streptomyces]|uniref:hypothetical protein n=1 Tax=Streptomyces TaxID=1883 RepID=UPI000F7A55E1|nr:MULTISPECIES: hypothetical protein [Streptomyces]RST04915.1 hypothetical protein EF910_15680 [Streptomyces sp. WAC07149]GLX22126.1 hypothetical protein Slala01_57700 [Streptomyces lavendulae subsp. lavendulae]GLX29834.1 hypothetical protein Slala02_56540 [Streptomyces lavendulae subsp. lavendulae]